jgi:hypothetical protein
MAAAVLAMRVALPVGWPVWMKLAVDLVVGGSSYLLALALLHRNELRNLMHIAKPA